MQERLIDLGRLTGIFRGDRQRMMAWIGIYLVEVAPLLASMAEHVEAGDDTALARAAHELKPQFHYLDAPAMQERVTALQEMTARHGAAACAALVVEIRGFGERIEQELRDHLQHA